MNDDPGNQGLEAYWTANPEVREIILVQAEKRVQAAVTRMDSLNQRLSGLCALMFAGAAVSAGFTINGDKAPHSAIICAGFAAVLFATGGAVGFLGLFSRQSGFPGESPSWWLARGKDDLTALKKDGANYWIAGQQETIAAQIIAAVNRRGTAFNIGVGIGAAAGAIIAVAAILTALQKGPEPIPATRPLLHLVLQPNSHWQNPRGHLRRDIEKFA